MKHITKTSLNAWILPIFATLILSAIFYPIEQKYSQSFKFVDENEHMVMAWLLDKGYRLYTDFPNNHQPISYFASYAVQHIFDIDNVFMLVKRHREAIFAWSILWWFLIIKRIGLKSTVPIFLFENIKYFTLGNEFLAEAIIVYPLAYIAGQVLVLSKRTLKPFDYFVAGLLTAFIQLTLLPMALTLGVLTSVRFIISKGKGWRPFLLGILTILLGIFSFVHIRDYLVEVTNALVYSLPGLSPVSSPWQSWRLFGLPVLYFPFYKDPIGQVVILMTLWWLLALLIFILKGKGRLVWLNMALMAAWLFTNTRVAKADVYFYEGFHLTPWLFAGLMGGFSAFWQAMKIVNKKKQWLAVGIHVILSVIIFNNQNLPLFTKIDPLTEHYVQYTPITQAALTINASKKTGDQLMVIPNESLIYYMTDLEPAPTNMFTFYDWQVDVPRNRSKFYQTLSDLPPAFIVYTDDGSSYGPFMNEFVKNNYIQLMQYPHVYLHRQYEDRLESVTNASENALEGSL
jgi:hypothetical protein